MPRISGVGHLPPIHQPDEAFSQAAPVQNTWYTILEDYNVRLIDVVILVATTNETLELRVTADNQVYTVSIAATAASWYNAIFDQSLATTLAVSLTEYIKQKEFFLEARHVKLEMRKTTAAGAGNLQSKVVWAKW